jgi:hypothetical protein
MYQNAKERDHLKNVSVGGRSIIKWIFEIMRSGWGKLTHFYEDDHELLFTLKAAHTYLYQMKSCHLQERSRTLLSVSTKHARCGYVE